MTQGTETFQLKMSLDELLAIHQSLNEVLNGIDITEFQTRVGYDRQFVKKIMDNISNIIKK